MIVYKAKDYKSERNPHPQLFFVIEDKHKLAIKIIEKFLDTSLIEEEIPKVNWSSLCVKIIFHKEDEFSYKEDLQTFGTEKHKFVKKTEPFFPILHLSVIRHLNLQDKAIDNDKDYRRGHVHRHQYVLDSSIWNYYYSFEQFLNEKGQKDTVSITSVLNDIYNNYQENLYAFSASIEYADFQRRLVECCKLANVDGGHSDAVSPFLFHSETAMRSKINVLTSRSSFLRNAKWRFLLVDDHATIGMSNIEDIKKGKADIIKSALSKYVSKNEIQIISYNSNRKCFENSESIKQITIHCVTSVAEARAVLNEGWRYDLILLDYKLKKNDNDNQEYGYHLLEEIKKDYDRHSRENKRINLLAKKETKPGPNGMYYFMFISAYSTAVQERLRMEGFRTKTDYWFLDRGACPLNTPYLFLYSLKRMIDNRYEMLTSHFDQMSEVIGLEKYIKNSATEISNINDNNTVINFLSVIFEKEERNRCVKGFNAFLNLRRLYDSIKNDIYTGDDRYKNSPLTQSLYPDLGCYSNSFWEHLQNLVYLTAFGTIRQWPEMWEDYTFIKGKLENAEGLYSKELTEDLKPSILIRNYILSLKGMMS